MLFFSSVVSRRKIWLYLLFQLFATTQTPVRAGGQEIDPKDPIRVIVFGRHPDDCELEAGGTAARWAKLGYKVKFVSVTNGDIGHHEMAGAILARRRTAEVKKCAEILGIETEVLDIHDGELLPTLENRRTITAQDPRVEGRCRDRASAQRLSPGPSLHRNPGPGRGLHGDRPQLLPRCAGPARRIPCSSTPKTTSRSRTRSRPTSSCRSTRCSITRLPASTPWSRSSTSGTPGSSAISTRFPRTRPRGWNGRATGSAKRYGGLADRFRPKLIELLGEEKGKAVKYAESFEVCEYGISATRDELLRIFPFFGGK